MSSPSVVARGLTIRFGQFEAIAASDLELPRGCSTALIGPNGSGKSTFLNVVAGLTEPWQGTIEVLGTTPRKARARISYVLQATKVNEAMPITVEEVVAMGRYAGRGLVARLSNEDRRAVRQAMERLDLIGLARRHLPELSGGQRQRVFVAQGIVQEHELLLLDEPLTGLDLISAEIIENLVAEECQLGRSVLMTTHDLAEAAAADQVVLMSNRIVAAGPPGSVLTADHLAEAYGARILHLDEGQLFIDDPAHRPGPGRHIHGERVIHTEVPGSALHLDDEGTTS